MTFLSDFECFGVQMVSESIILESACRHGLVHDMTHITFSRNVVSNEHTTSAVFVAFQRVLPLRGGIFYGLVKNIKLHFNTRLN